MNEGFNNYALIMSDCPAHNTSISTYIVVVELLLVVCQGGFRGSLLIVLVYESDAMIVRMFGKVHVSDQVVLLFGTANRSSAGSPGEEGSHVPTALKHTRC
jgi:hypothetical protein